MLASLSYANSQWFSSTLEWTRCLRQLYSSFRRKSKALPEVLQPRQVRPTRWMYSLMSRGGSNCTIQSTYGMSKPLAATSVHRRIPFFIRPNSWKVVDRFCCFCLPWMSMTLTSTQFSRFEKNLTLLQDEKKTIIFLSFCFCRKVKSSWNFLSAEIITKPCQRLCTVALAFSSSTPMQIGSLSDNLASQSTFCV